MALLFSSLIAGTCPAQGQSTAVADNMLDNLRPADKAAVLLVSFGTTHDDTRALTIDTLAARVRREFPQLVVAQAFTSRIVIRRLRARGIEIDTPIEAMLKLRARGVTHLVVQSTNIIEGEEMQSLRQDAAAVQPFFREIRIGNPLLYDVSDVERVTAILAGRIPADEKRREHVLFVGHGTEGPATAIYSQADYMFRAAGLANRHVGTIEGYPALDQALSQLREAGARQVTLAPLMFVAGDHARNDISVEWKAALEAAGFRVVLHIEGLGEIPAIQELFIEHLRFAMHHHVLGIMEKKAIYASETD